MHTEILTWYNCERSRNVCSKTHSLYITFFEGAYYNTNIAFLYVVYKHISDSNMHAPAEPTQQFSNLLEQHRNGNRLFSLLFL